MDPDRFTLDIELAEPTMATPLQVADALRRLADDIGRLVPAVGNGFAEGDRGRIRDGAGVTVGGWQVAVKTS